MENSTFTKRILPRERKGYAMSSVNYEGGFYAEVKKGEWFRVSAPVKLTPKKNRKRILGGLRPSDDRKTMRFSVIVPGSLFISIGSEKEKVLERNCVVKQRDFTITDKEGTELRVVWSAGNGSPPRTKEPIDFTEAEEGFDLTDA